MPKEREVVYYAPQYSKDIADFLLIPLRIWIWLLFGPFPARILAIFLAFMPYFALTDTWRVESCHDSAAREQSRLNYQAAKPVYLDYSCPNYQLGHFIPGILTGPSFINKGISEEPIVAKVYKPKLRKRELPPSFIEEMNQIHRQNLEREIYASM